MLDCEIKRIYIHAQTSNFTKIIEVVNTEARRRHFPQKQTVAEKNKTETETERERAYLTLKMRFLLVASHAKPPRKYMDQTRTRTKVETPSACTTNVNGVADTPSAISFSLFCYSSLIISKK